MYKTIDMLTDVNFIAHDRKERKSTLNYLKSKYPSNSIIGVQLEDKLVEIWILEWNAIKNPNKPNEYIIGGRGVATDSNQEYIIKPVKKESK